MKLDGLGYSATTAGAPDPVGRVPKRRGEDVSRAIRSYVTQREERLSRMGAPTSMLPPSGPGTNSRELRQ
jgi:hypothetical protein